MSDYIGKTIGIFLAIIILGIGPLCNSASLKDAEQKVAILNDIQEFIDETVDTGQISNARLSDFYLACNSHGVIVAVDIQRELFIVNPDGAGGTYGTYTVVDDISEWNRGDVITVHVEAIGATGWQKLLYTVARIWVDKPEYTISASIRK